MIERHLEISIKGSLFFIHGERALYWPSHRWLIISDVHLGKATHFRKSGIALPTYSSTRDYERIADLIQFYQPETVVFTGDLFHSESNGEWDQFIQFRQQFSCDFALIEGNHDLLTTEHLAKAQIQDWGLQREIDQFTFQHHPEELTHSHVICGHLHPGVSIRGKAKQGVKLPALIVTKNCTYLPAFGELTGCVTLKNIKPEKTFAFAGGQIIAL